MAEEMNSTTQAVSEDQVDYMEGWDTGGVEYPEETVTTEEAHQEADQQAGGEEAETDQEPGDQAEAAEAEETPEAQEEGTGEEPAKEDTLTIRYMGKDETISRAEAIVLAQKGRNYDNIHQRMEEAEAYRAANLDAMAFLQRMAELEARAAGRESMPVEEYIDACEIRMKVNQGMSEAQARRELDLERREARLARKEEQQAQKRPQSEETEKDRVAKDKAEFQRTFADVDIGSLPKEVWQEMARTPGQGLTAAYAKYLANRAAAAEAEAKQAQDTLRQREEARRRAPGRMRDVNPKPQKSKEDEFFAGWEF